MIQWKDEFSVGIPKMDEQHKQLFEIAWKIHDMLNDDIGYSDKYDKIVSVINELRDYAKYHFEEEEKYLTEKEYNGMFLQKVEHDKFNQKMLEIDLEHVDDNQEKYIQELLDFTLTWIVDHILDVDKGYMNV